MALILDTGVVYASRTTFGVTVGTVVPLSFSVGNAASSSSRLQSFPKWTTCWDGASEAKLNCCFTVV